MVQCHIKTNTKGTFKGGVFFVYFALNDMAEVLSFILILTSADAANKVDYQYAIVAISLSHDLFISHPEESNNRRVIEI